MAISRGNESKEVQEFKRYVGITPVMVAAVNPTKEEHERLFNTTLDEAPKYVETREDSEGKSYKSARVQLVFQPDNEKIGLEMPLVSMALFLQDRPRTGASSGKTQVIDKYGRTAWVTPQELEAHAIPVYSNGPADIDKDYRPAYTGEEDLMAFVKAYLCIPDISVWDENLKRMIPNTKVKPEDCECRFDNLDKVFSGDFSEIIDALGYQPTNKVKVMLGVRTAQDTGKMFQVVYTRKFLRNSSNNYNSMSKEIQNNIKYAEESGKSIDTEYSAKPVHEYVVTPTVFAPAEAPVPTDEMPFGDSTAPFPF